MGRNFKRKVIIWDPNSASLNLTCIFTIVSNWLNDSYVYVFQEFCKCLSRMFKANNLDVVFFETVRYLNRQPHTFIECVPAKDKDSFEMIAFYFKKAILESETEWAMNKKLHTVNGMEVRKVVPKGLPYFWINFNFENGFAHVIEDQETFKSTFAHETVRIDNIENKI